MGGGRRRRGGVVCWWEVAKWMDGRRKKRTVRKGREFGCRVKFKPRSNLCNQYMGGLFDPKIKSNSFHRKKRKPIFHGLFQIKTSLGLFLVSVIITEKILKKNRHGERSF
jgi:hypothetical protein